MIILGLLDLIFGVITALYSDVIPGTFSDSFGDSGDGTLYNSWYDH